MCRYSVSEICRSGDLGIFLVQVEEHFLKWWPGKRFSKYVNSHVLGWTVGEFNGLLFHMLGYEVILYIDVFRPDLVFTVFRDG